MTEDRHRPTRATPVSVRDAVPERLTRADALFLDFDGTLVELAEHPDRVAIPATLKPLLQDLELKLGGALALVTGRRLESLDSLLAPLRLKGAGLHGAQFRIDAMTAVATEAPALPGIAAHLRARYDADPEIWIEDKGAAIAVHYRRAPHREREVGDAVRLAVERSGDAEVRIVPGKLVLEARRAGVGKDSALRDFMSRPPFAGRSPVFLGDDITDEDGIVAADALGGRGIKVGPGDSAARFRLAGPAQVIEWLHASLANLS